MDNENGITVEQVKDYLIQNKEKPEIVTLFSELNPRPDITADDVRPFLETKEGRELIQPYGDKRVTDALATYKKGAFEAEVKARVAAKILELNPGETPEQKRIRELEEKDVARDREWAQKDLRAQIEKLAYKEGINPDFISGINFNSIEEASLYTKNLKGEFETIQKKVTNDLLANGSYRPKTGEVQDKGPNIAGMTSKEKFDYFKEQAEQREMDNAAKVG